MRKCSKCGIEKTADSFPKSGVKGGLSSWCRECHHERYKLRKREAAERLMRNRQDPMRMVANAIAERGVTTKELAEAIGISPVNVGKWLSGKSRPRQKNLRAAFEFLGLDLPMEMMAANDGRIPLGVSQCAECGADFPVYKAGTKFCSRACSGKDLSSRQLGEANRRWKGGETVTTHIGGGYIKQLAPGHPAADASGYVLQHRLVMEQVLGRPLKKSERVHHKNGKRDDNRPENLELWTGTGTSKKDPHGIRMVDKVIDLLDSLTPAERRKVEERIKELDK